MEKNICLNSPIKKISHKNNFIKEIRGDKKTIKVNQVISTLPLNYFIKILDPISPPKYILKIIKSFKFRAFGRCAL